MKASPWTTPRVWKDELSVEVLSGVRSKDLNMRGLKKSTIIHPAPALRRQLEQMARDTYLVPSYEWCVKAVVEAALATPPQTAEHAWRNLVRQRALVSGRSQPSDPARKEYAEYCIGFVVAWRQVSELCGN